MTAFKICVSITLLIAFSSCSSPDKNTKISSVPEKQQHGQEKWIKKSVDIDSFLAKPFDLLSFKAKKNGSNWGITELKDYHDQSIFKGQGLKFFMFEPKAVNYVSNGRKMRRSNLGYIGKIKINYAFLEDGLILKTLRPISKEYSFSDPNEVLIELTAKYNDFDLSEMAYVGIDSSEIVQIFGKQSFYKKDCLVYANNKAAFVLHLKNGVVDWLKYVRLSPKIKNSSGIDELFVLK